MNSNLKQFFFGGVGDGGVLEWGASEFFNKESKSKKRKKNLGGGWGWGG